MKKISIALLAFIMIFSFAACGSDSGDAENEPVEDAEVVELPESDDVLYAEEAEGFVIERVETDPAAYVGTWESNSNNAVLLYGNVRITVNADGTWTGNISEEDLSGKWEDKGTYLHMDNEMFSFDLAFDEAGTLVMIENNDGSELNTVLTKVE